MLILFIMCLGILIGNRFIPDTQKKNNERLQLICTLLLIFSMGVKLGQQENLLRDLTSLGFQSLLFCLIPTVLSIVFVFFLTRHFMHRGEKHRDGQTEKD